MQKTANQIKSSFELLASGHYQIHSFLYAQEFEQQAYENLIYPLMLVYPLGGSLSGTTYSRNYRVIIADRVLKSEGNELEVESDTQLIALDVLAYWMKLGQNERFTITSSNTITPFWEKWGDDVTGHFVDIGIEEFYDFNSCAIPLSGSIPTPPNPCKDARISVNSVVYGNAPSDSNFNVVVKDQLGSLVGSLIGGEWIVNTGGSCADATYTIEDTLGNVLYTGSIVSGGSLTQAIGNSTLNVNNSAGTLISSESILAEGTDSYNVADSIAVIKDSAGTTLKSENILATASENITINDSVAVIKDSANNTLKSENILAEASENISISDSVAVIKDSANLTLKTENILAEATENIVINDSLVNVRKSDNVLISAVSVKAENTENYLVADSLIENAAISPTYSQLVKATEGLILPTQEIQNNGVASGFIPSVGTINVTTNVPPTSFNVTGRNIDIFLPSGGVTMDVDFSANKLTAAPFEDITFTDLSDESPTYWSWRFSDGTTSIVQNPVKSFVTTGFKNITLMAGRVGAGGVAIKNSYIEIVGDPIYLAFIAAFNTATSSTIGATQDAAVLGLVQRLRGVGTTNGSDLLSSGKISALYPYVPVNNTTANSAGMALDLLLNFNGSFVNFVSGDFQPNGITGGTSKYFNTNYNPVTQADSITDFSFGFDAATSTTATINPMGVRNVNDTYTAAVYAGGNFITGIAESANLTRFASANMPANLNSVNVLSTTKKVFNAGVEIDSVTRTGTSFFNGNFFCHASNSIGVATGFDSRRFRGFYIGKGLTNNEQADLYEAWNWFQQNVITGGR